MTAKTVHRKWSHVVKMKAGSLWPYKVVVGSSSVFHSWHKSRQSAMAEAARINKSHSGYTETWR